MQDDAGGPGAGGATELHVLLMSPDSFLSLPLPCPGTVDIGRSSKCAIRLDDPLASRTHARLHATLTEGALLLELEDLGSANGTRLRDRRVPGGQRIPFVAGEAITVGSTVLMVQQNRPAFGLRRLWSHAYFETRLEDECARAISSGHTLTLVRLEVGRTPWTRVVPSLVRHVPQPHLFAAYGPRDYELLFLELQPDEVTAKMTALVADLAGADIEARYAMAHVLRDGRSADALLARANAALKRPPATTAGAVSPDSATRESDTAAGMERIRELARRAAGANINVLILGETGVGKDVLARTIHRLSGRKGEFVALNCAGLAPTLIENELFGHERGAFTGAAAARMGLLESGNGGTVFLDEIGEMPTALQAKLLRTLETRTVTPVGGVKTRPIDVRFIAATNRDLEAEVGRGTFRQDLYFRLNGITLAIPPLRERTGEIPALIDTFIRDVCVESGRTPVPVVVPAAMEALLAYQWPGNIRELRNVIERALVLCDGSEIWPEHLPVDKMKTLPRQAATGVAMAPSPSSSTHPEVGLRPTPLEPDKEAERQRIVEALAASAGNQTRAAALLGMPRRTFVSKLEAYGIPRPQKSGGGGSRGGGPGTG